MKLLAVYGSPRVGGNSDLLLDEAIKGARSAGAEVKTLRVCDATVSGCIECGGCDDTGECVIEDEMQSIYPMFVEAEAMVLAAPMFFYGVPSQVKAVMDRCQALWCRRALQRPRERWKDYESGRGYAILVGATKGANLFEGTKLAIKYWFDALDMSFEDGVYVKSVEKKGDILNHPDALKAAFDLGVKAVEDAKR
ncbi:MAG: flavodoxin family protein [Pseudomonadota bacterium]